jgi:hypothetical protein
MEGVFVCVAVEMADESSKCLERVGCASGGVSASCDGAIDRVRGHYRKYQCERDWIC